MSHQSRSAKQSVVGMVLCSLVMLSPVGSHAAPDVPTQVCTPLESQLRYHEPFFGTREWREVAQETLSFASPACREALASGQGTAVVTALRTLEQRAVLQDPQLKRYVYRVACQLRVSALREQIFAGTSEPGVYVDCVDAVFALGWTDQESTDLRNRYLDGLNKEPLTTPIPPSAFKPPYVERLAQVLGAYDTARLPKRDSLFQALCIHNIPTTDAAKAVCTGPAEREPQWAKAALEEGNIRLGISYLATLAPRRLPEFLPVLHKFDQQHIAGRDRLHRMLCQQRVLATPELLPACRMMREEAEPRWAHEEKTQEINDELIQYHRIAFGIGKFLGLLSMLIIGHAIFVNRRRSLAALAAAQWQSEHGAV